MNLNDLSRIDIKDLQKIDYKKLLADLRSQPDILLSLAAIFVAIAFSFHIFTQTQSQIAALHSQTAQLETKVKKIDAYNATKAELAEFLNNMPQHITEPELVSLITEYAKRRNIQIGILSPQKSETNQYFNSLGASLSIIAPRYKDIWLFVRDLEHSKYGIRIDTWQLTQGPEDSAFKKASSRLARNTKGPLVFKANLSVSAINIQSGK